MSGLDTISNTTDDPEYIDFFTHDEQQTLLRKRMQVAIIVIYSLAFVLGVLGNGLVIFITGFRMKKTVNTVWFFNLAIADFTFIFSLIFVHAALQFEWYTSLVMCKINSTLTFLNLYASVYLLTVISIDRCVSVRHPVWAQNHRTPQLASFVALGVWIFALVLCSPIVYFKQTIVISEATDDIKCSDNYSNTIEILTFMHHAIVISRFIFAFVIPFTVILVCYGAIVMRLRNSVLSQSKKPLQVITGVIVAFFVCWFPYHVFSFIDMKHSSNPEMWSVVNTGVPLASCLGFINSSLNPILYVFMGQSFRKTLRESLFSAFENAFTEEVRQIATTNKPKCSVEL